MNEYFFLYGIALIAVLFSVVQDIRFREIANWVTFSLIAFVLAYRAFYSIYSNNLMFFVYGLIGVLLFVSLGYLFYYSKIFAGGDAKLLFGLGGIFPYSSFLDYVYYGFGFILFLFLGGIVYTLIYSGFLIKGNSKAFKESFRNQFREKKKYFLISLFGLLLIIFGLYDLNSLVGWISAIFVFILPLIFIYIHAIESSCMIKLTPPDKITEGDWLEKDVFIGSKVIKKSFHGLSFDEILLLRKSGKKILIKTGVPFAPSFLIALLVFLTYILRYSSL